MFQKQNWNHSDVNKGPISVVLHRKSLCSRWGLGIFIMPEASLKHQHFFLWIQSLLCKINLNGWKKKKWLALWYALEILDWKSISSGLQSELSPVVQYTVVPLQNPIHEEFVFCLHGHQPNCALFSQYLGKMWQYLTVDQINC